MAAATALPRPAFGSPDIVCLSHRRWELGHERPHHLMTRFARGRSVFFVEEPVIRCHQNPRLNLAEVKPGLRVARPEVPPGLGPEATDLCQAVLLENMLHQFGCVDYVLWYDTPRAVTYTRGLSPAVVVYDCAHSADCGSGDPSGAREWEEELLDRADLVFTDGHSPHEARSARQPNIFTFPSGDQAPVPLPLRGLSWDRTFAAMDRLLRTRLSRRCLRLVASRAEGGSAEAS